MCLRVVYQASAIIILQNAVATNPEENTSWSPRAQTAETDRVTGHADFDEAKYNISTGPVPQREIVPAIEECFPQDFDTNYSYVWDTSNSSVTHTTSATLESFITGLCLRNISANCGISTLVVQEYVVMNDGSGNRSSSGSGFLPSVVCPGPRTINQTYTSFLIEDPTIGECPTTTMINSQELVSSTIGDTLYPICSSTTNRIVNLSFIIGHGHDTPNHLSSRVNGTMSYIDHQLD
ncbi:hypothetical protein EV424DRAFT_1558042 [Suillus variegatus]|nr:hypothetical protein EV424DRAFT_1558042 [Suillus variegatus]